MRIPKDFLTWHIKRRNEVVPILSELEFKICPLKKKKKLNPGYTTDLCIKHLNQGCSRSRDLRDRDRDMGGRDQDRDRGHLN